MTVASERLLVVENVVAGYGERTILDDVSLTVDPGEIVVVLGGSGSGKSTLLRTIVGLLPPTSGRVLVRGRDVNAASDAARDEILRDIGMSFQTAALLGSLSVVENVALPILEHTDLDEETAFMMARLRLAEVGLAGSEWKRPTELSGGMRKRAGIARALALEPALLLFDEPSAGLDPVTARELDELILELGHRGDIGVVAVTHELGSIQTIADRAVMLADGKVIAAGTLDEMRASGDARVQAFFRREAGGRSSSGKSLLEEVEWTG